MGTAAVLMEQVVSCAAGGGLWPAFTRGVQSLDPQTSAAARRRVRERVLANRLGRAAVATTHQVLMVGIGPLMRPQNFPPPHREPAGMLLRRMALVHGH